MQALGEVAEDVPGLIPARMLNEVVYCPRLMFLEWVQGEWRDNHFTLDGTAKHGKVDGGGGVVAAPEDEDEVPRIARSVWLSSERLGITAKIDLLETAAGEAVPVETKRGKRAPTPEQVYLPELVQVGAQALLLRDRGYRCHRAIVYFAKERRRVEVVIDRRLIEMTLRAVRRAAQVAAREEPPPPLVASPKCVGCSLSSICLPDELGLLQERAPLLRAKERHGHLRRLIPSGDVREPLYVQAQGGRIGIRGEQLVVRAGEEESKVRIPNTSQVCVMGNVQVTTQALRELMKRKIPVSFFTSGGWYLGRASGVESNNIDLRRFQFRLADDPETCTRIARRLIASKIRNCRTLLKRNYRGELPEECGRSLKVLASRALSVSSVETLLGVEGTAARVYFSEFSGMLKNDELGTFKLSGRNRRPPRDPVNALLSLAYALLTKECVLACRAVGLEPLLGFLHKPRFGRPALALDLMEEFRPIVADSVVVSAINNGVVQRQDFRIHPVAVALKPGGRKKFISAFERRLADEVTHPLFGYRISYRRVLEVQARLLSRYIAGEIDSVPTFQTR